MEFELDPAKDRSNRRKHGVSFAEAQRLFVVVVYTEPEEGRCPIIGARMASKRERDLYISRRRRFE